MWYEIVNFVFNFFISVILFSGMTMHWGTGAGKIMLAVFVLLVIKWICQLVLYIFVEKPKMTLTKTDEEGNTKTVFVMQPNGRGGKNVHS